MIGGEAMRAARLSAGLSVGALAEKAGVYPTTIYRLENGVTRGEVDTLIRLSRALGISIDAYLGEMTPTQPMSEEVEVMIPYDGRSDPNLFIGINGINYLLPKGRKLKLPPVVAAEYFRSLRAAEAFERTKEELAFTKDERCSV